jgi:Fur family ferric uptake transcriptional regulator
MKGVGEHGCAQQKLDGALRHPDFDLLDGVCREHIALLDVHPVNAARGQARQHDDESSRRAVVGGSRLGHNAQRSYHWRGDRNVERQDLRDAGLKVTSPRLKVLEILETARERHLSAEGIYRLLLESGDELGLATVYRVLMQFEQAGLVRRHHFEGGTAVFELTDRSHHDHMICLETGRVIEFFDDRIEQIQKDIAERHGYVLEEHSLVLYVRPKKPS